MRSNSVALLDNHLSCPNVWHRYKNGEIVTIDIWRPEILTKSSQLPNEGSDDDLLLQQLFSFGPFDFERVVVGIFREVKEVTHHIENTRKIGDVGFDFFGRFVL